MTDTPVKRVRLYAEAHAATYGKTPYISRLYAGAGTFNLTVDDLIAVTEATKAPLTPSTGDPHLRVEFDGFRLYDGPTYISGPWGWGELAGAQSALEAVKKAVAHGG